IDKFQELSVLAPRIYLAVPRDFARLVPVGHCSEPQRFMPTSIGRPIARIPEPIEDQGHPCGLVVERPSGEETVLSAKVLSPVKEEGVRTQHLDRIGIALHSQDLGPAWVCLKQYSYGNAKMLIAQSGRSSPVD